MKNFTATVARFIARKKAVANTVANANAPIHKVSQKELAATIKQTLRFLTYNMGGTEQARLDLEDALQSALLKIYVKPTAWNPEKNDLGKFLYMVAKRLYINKTDLKAYKTSSSFSSLAMGEGSEETNFDPSGSIAIGRRTWEERELFAAYIRPVLSKMRTKMALQTLKIMVLERWGLKTDEMADYLGLNPNTLRVTQLRIREKMEEARQYLTN